MSATHARRWQIGIPACFSFFTAIVLGFAAASCHHKGGGAGVTLQSLAITPPAPSFALGFSRALVATGTYSDHTTRDLTASVTWTTSDAAIATVSNTSGSSGVVASLATGAVQITATDTASGKTASTAVTITSAVLVQLDLTPAAPAVAAGFTRQFTATGLFSDNTTQDLTTAVAWNSSNAAAVTISNAAGAQGNATGVGVGAATITATHVGTGILGATAMTVTPAVLVSIGVTPETSIALGYSQQFTASGTFSDNTTQDLTAAVTWNSSATAVATISNASGTQGLATSAAVGATTITATDPTTSISGQTSLAVTSAVLVSIAVTPAAPSIALGYSQQFTATGTFSDNTTQDLTAAVTWSSSTTATATISNASGTQGLATSAATGSTTITATDPATSLDGTTSLAVTSAVLVSIDVTPANPSLALGYSQPFAATGTFSDNTTQDLTTAVTWGSSTPATATISNASGTQGLATTAAVGATTITATDPATSISGQTSFLVTPAVLVSIAVTPAAPSIALGYAQQFTATGTFSDNTTQDLTATATWGSSTLATATVSNAAGTQGLATSVAVGATTITAMDGSIAGAANLAVTPAVLVSIAVTPAAPSIALGYGQQFTATGTFSDNKTQDLTAAVTWSSSVTAKATISNAAGTQGLATSAAVGATTITATDPATSISGQTSLLVTPAVLVSIAVTPAAPSIALGYGQQFAATGTFSDNTTQDLTATVTWSSSTPATATISNASGTQGLATSAAVGATTITATDPATSSSGQTSFAVTSAVLVSIAVTPAASSIALGYGEQFTATGTFSDNTTQDLTATATWSSSAPAVASIGNAAGTQGLATSAAVGSTTITAMDGSIFGSANLAVTPALLVSIDVTPANRLVALGYDQQFTATGMFSDNTTQDITLTVLWSSSVTSTATISNASGTQGLATSAAPGSTAITATDAGSGIAASTTLTVTPAVLVSIAVTPAAPSIALGFSEPFAATGTFSDNSTRDITTDVTWSSSATATATISNASGTQGLATTAAVGATTITATDPATSISGQTSLTVTSAVLVSIAVTPATPSIPRGYGQQFTAIGTFSNASTQDITAQVTWSSSVPGCATISNAAGSEGLAASAAPGATTIVAIDSGTAVSGSAALTVTAAVLVSIAVAPTAPTVALGFPQQFTATGTFSDSSTSNLTAAVTWISSSTPVATISNASGSEGLASTANIGSTSIGAIDPGTGISASTTLSVTAAVLVSIAISPLAPTVALGSGQQFTATGTYSDNSTQDLTAAVVWSSSVTATATISNVSGTAGFASSVAQGSTTIGATHTPSGLTTSTTLAVGDPIVFRNSSRVVSPGGLTLTLATPASTAANEVMLAAIAVRPSSATVSAPNGWTLVRRSNNLPPNTSSLLIYRRVATASEPATHKWTFSNSQGSAGCILSFQGVNTATIIDVQNGQGTPSSLTHATPSVTTTAANAMIVTFHMITSGVTWTSPAGMTEVVDISSDPPPTNGGVTLLACWQFQAVAGSTGTRTATASNNPGTGNACIVALRD